MESELIKRIKSLIWRTFGVAFIAVSAYYLQIGDIWQLDIKMLVNIGLTAGVGLIFNEVTKHLNK